ncbi:hypothetical protein [Bartonella sp. LJL80]
MSEIFNPLVLGEAFDKAFGKDAAAVRGRIAGMFLQRLARHSRGQQFAKLQSRSFDKAAHWSLSIPIGFMRGREQGNLFDDEPRHASRGFISKLNLIPSQPIIIPVPTTRERMKALSHSAQPAMVKMIGTSGGMASLVFMLRLEARNRCLKRRFNNTRVSWEVLLIKPFRKAIQSGNQSRFYCDKQLRSTPMNIWDVWLFLPV